MENAKFLIVQFLRIFYTVSSLSFPQKSVGKNAKQLSVQASLWAWLANGDAVSRQ